jgi:multidrug transporter EmrE-like cation transporter
MNNQLGVVASSLLGASFYYGSDLFAGKSMSKFGALESNLLRFVYLGAISLIYLIFISKTPLFPTDSSQNMDYTFILLTAIGMGIGNTILIWTLQRYNAATVMSYFESFGVLLGAVIGYLYFKEAISTSNMIAIGVIMLGIFLYTD